MQAELPGVAEEINAEEWIHQPGLPDNAPLFASAQLEKLESLAKGWSDGTRPDVDEANAWAPSDWQIYLQALPQILPSEDCAWLDENFELTRQGNCEILCDWLVIAIGSNYEPAFERVASFLDTVGRMKYLKPLYSTLHAGETTRALAAEIFAKNAGSYHPIARAGLERLLTN
jgi:hypothetical protein